MEQKINELEAQNKGLLLENEALKATIKEKEELITELMQTVQDSEVSKGSKYPVFTVKGNQYELVVPKSSARIDGKKVAVTEQSLKADKKLLEALVKQGVGVLQLIEKEA
jgi:hypothetical protein